MLDYYQTNAYFHFLFKFNLLVYINIHFFHLPLLFFDYAILLFARRAKSQSKRLINLSTGNDASHYVINVGIRTWVGLITSASVSARPYHNIKLHGEPIEHPICKWRHGNGGGTELRHECCLVSRASRRDLGD